MSEKLPVILSSRNGKEYIKSRPEKVRRTDGTKASAGLFGISSTTASQVVSTFKPLVGFPYYMSMYKRLHSALREWMQTEVSYPQKPLENIVGIMGFRFITEAGIFNRFTAPYSISYAAGGDVLVNIPAFTPTEEVYAPGGCTSFGLKLMAVSCKPFEKTVVDIASHNVDIPFSNQQQAALQIQLPLQAGDDTITLIAMALQYNNIVWGTFADERQLRWMPAGVIGCLWK